MTVDDQRTQLGYGRKPQHFDASISLVTNFPFSNLAA